MIGSGRTASFSRISPLLLLVCFLFAGCSGADGSEESKFTADRKRMIVREIAGRDITDPAVLKAMGEVPRHLFVDPVFRSFAYADRPLPIRKNQSISQPYIVALMTQLARLKPSDSVLEIGTGSGYQAAVLGEIVRKVYGIEIIPELAFNAIQRLKELEYVNVRVKQGDGFKGWPAYAPFDAILITASAPEIPQPLIEQLKVGGRMVLPLESKHGVQNLVVMTKTEKGLEKKFVTGVAFVPMTGEVRNREGKNP